MPENKDNKDLKEHKQEEAFKVVDRRLFTAEGELRDEAVQQERNERIAAEVAAKALGKPSEAAQQTTTKKETPQPLAAFKNLISLIAESAVMYAGAYADPRTGEPIIEPEALRNIVDMLDALREKTQGNLAPEEDALIVDLSGKLKMTYLEISKAAADPVRAKAKARS